MTTKLFVPKISYAYDDPRKTDYLFDDWERLKHEDVEYIEWAWVARPKEKLKVQNQGNKPACTSYAEGHVTNANNILEDVRQWQERPQINPEQPRDDFCRLRNEWNTWTSIQVMAEFYKTHKFIQWYVTIPNTQQDLVNKMKLSLDNWNFLVTWSSNWDRGMIGITGVYSIRWDTKFVWHSFSIVSYEADYFRAINSWGDWWPFHGYFKIPFSLVHELYSKLAIIDFSDNIYFQRLKDRLKAQQMVSIAKELYANGNWEVKDYFDNIKLSANMERLYGK